MTSSQTWNRRLENCEAPISLEEVRQAMRRMGEYNYIIAEGAGAVATAAALSGMGGNGIIACIVSGGNIDREVFAKILGAEVT